MISSRGSRFFFAIPGIRAFQLPPALCSASLIVTHPLNAFCLMRLSVFELKRSKENAPHPPTSFSWEGRRAANNLFNLPGLRGTTFIRRYLTTSTSAGNPNDVPVACSRGLPASSTPGMRPLSSRSFRVFFAVSKHISFHQPLTLWMLPELLLVPAMLVRDSIFVSTASYTISSAALSRLFSKRECNRGFARGMQMIQERVPLCPCLNVAPA